MCERLIVMIGRQAEIERVAGAGTGRGQHLCQKILAQFVSVHQLKKSEC